MPSQSDGRSTTKLSDISSSLLENRFFQNQILRQGTSLAGPTLIAAGRTMIKTGSAPRTEYRSHLQLRDSTGKRKFKPYYQDGRYYSKPLRQPFVRWGPEYGYRTNPRGVTKRSPSRVKTGKVIRGVGRASGIIGLGLVAYNIHRHGAKETAEDEVKFNYSISPLGVIDRQFFDGAISNNRYLNSAPGRTVSAVAQMALLEALL